MKQATKGALAAATAVVLLSGGAGTLAYWTGAQDVTGGNISSGKLTLSTPVCNGSDADGVTHNWVYDNGGAAFTSGSKVVPGDTLTKVCAMTLNLVGDHIGADLTLEDPQFTSDSNGALTEELDPTATFTVDGDDTDQVSSPGAHTVLATVTVTFPYGEAATTGDQNVSAALDAMTLTAKQTHHTTADPAPVG